MGSILLGIVARRRSEKRPLSDRNNNFEVGESALASKEVLLLESPPVGTKHRHKLIEPEPGKQAAANIGKIARIIPDRKVREEQQVTIKVSHEFLISSCENSCEANLGTVRSEANCAFKKMRRLKQFTNINVDNGYGAH